MDLVQFEFIIWLLIMLRAWCDKCMKLLYFPWHTTIYTDQHVCQVWPWSYLWGPHQPPVQCIIFHCVQTATSTLGTWPDFIPHSHWEMPKNSSMPPSPPDWISGTHFSVGSPARPPRDRNTFKKDPAQSTEIGTHYTHPVLKTLASFCQDMASCSGASMATLLSTPKN